MWALAAFGLALASADPAPPPIHYTGPQDPMETALDKYEFDRWEAKQALFIASDEVNLRKTPSATSEKAATLAMGTPVVIRAPSGDAVRIADRVDRWYEVEVKDDPKVSGFVFGGALTPYRFIADLDGDGEDEIITVAMAWNFKIRVRVLERDKKGDGRTAELDLTPAGEGYLSVRGGSATASLVSAKEAGIPLLRIDSRPEACADFSRTYVSYRVPDEKPATSGKLYRALELFGLSDPPSFSDFEVAFDPKAKSALVVRRTAESEDEKGDPIFKKTKARYRLKGSVFVKK